MAALSVEFRCHGVHFAARPPPAVQAQRVDDDHHDSDDRDSELAETGRRGKYHNDRDATDPADS